MRETGTPHAAASTSGEAFDEPCVARVPLFQGLSHDEQFEVATVATPTQVQLLSVALSDDVSLVVGDDGMA